MAAPEPPLYSSALRRRNQSDQINSEDLFWWSRINGMGQAAFST